MRDTFRPEFLNRIDEIIIFSRCRCRRSEHIVDLQLREIADGWRTGTRVHLTEAARHGWRSRAGIRSSVRDRCAVRCNGS